MFRTLYAKLAIVLFGLFCLIGGAFIIEALNSAYMYQQEVTQRLNRNLAMYIVNKHVLIKNGNIDQRELEKLFNTLMIVNPSLELYLLGPQGRVMAQSVGDDKVNNETVSLQPIRSMLSGTVPLPVLGDDPLGAGRKKAFSAASIMADGKLQGYIYAILGGEQFDHITELLQKSYIMRWSAGAIGAALLFALAAGLIVFSLLTRRLRTLSQAMENFKQQDFTEFSPSPELSTQTSDEIGSLCVSFTAMAMRIQTQMERLQEKDLLRRELVANVSHDLRTPLASLKGYLETLLLKDESLSAEERRMYMETADRHAERLSRLVAELFELAKLDAKDLKPQYEAFSPAELAHDVVHKFQLRAQQQDIQLKVQVEADTPLVDADIGMIERVLDNLLENALRYTPEGGTIRVTTQAHTDHIAVVVADTGAGIPADQLPHIFERFYRKSTPNAPTGNGAGLGLAIAQRIIELHGGTLSVESALNKGSVFGFNLPTHQFA